MLRKILLDPVNHLEAFVASLLTTNDQHLLPMSASSSSIPATSSTIITTPRLKPFSPNTPLRNKGKLSTSNSNSSLLGFGLGSGKGKDVEDITSPHELTEFVSRDLLAAGRAARDRGSTVS